MSPVVTSDDVFTAISDKILPLVRIVSRRNVLAPLQRMRVIHRQKNCHNTPYTLPPLNKGRDRIYCANAALTINATGLMRIVHCKTITALGAVIPKVLKLESTQM